VTLPSRSTRTKLTCDPQREEEEETRQSMFTPAAPSKPPSTPPPRGSHIFVDRGTYNENLLITTDGIIFVSNGATLAPPEYPEVSDDNDCTGFAGPINPGVDEMPTQAGICVAGGGLDLADFAGEHKRVNSVRAPVKGV
jgi:hypothetical protein